MAQPKTGAPPGAPAIEPRDIPQANRLDQVREVLELLAAGHLDEAHAMALGIQKRQQDYCLRAAASLGLIDLPENDSPPTLSPLGRRMLATERRSRSEAADLQEAITESHVLRPFSEFLAGRENATRDQLTARIRGLATIGEKTAERRAQTLIAWRRYLLGEAPRHGGRHSRQGELPLVEDDVDPGERTKVHWPPPARFPHNDHREDRHVEDTVRPDLVGGSHLLLVTGYSSLDYLVGFLAERDTADEEPIRILFGTEPAVASRETAYLKSMTVAEEMRDYWLEQGFSILQGGALLRTLELSRKGKLVVRISRSQHRRVHAKVFVSDGAVTLGSSNFSRGGMRELLEGNVRFLAREKSRYQEAVRLAEGLWETGADWDEDFRALLDELLRKVTWQEALARGCAYLLEGTWTTRFLLPNPDEEGAGLWPSQRQGIAQALWVLEQVGSVLIADATGSGKTRVGAYVLRILRERLFAAGRSDTLDLRRTDPVLFCPPGVRERWRDELALCGMSLEPISHAQLSKSDGVGHPRILKSLNRTQILALDEGHNFINHRSKRTMAVLGNMADHTVIFTATPINRGAGDLLSIINLLGADNLPDETLRLLQQSLWSRRGQRNLSEESRDLLRREIQSFAVRRTKRAFNALIDREPNEYRNALGERCRFPEQKAEYYPCVGTDEDEQLAAEIGELAGQLRGLVNLKGPIHRTPDLIAFSHITDERYVQVRLAAATALARHMVMGALRSSPVALLEHLIGTDAAARHYGITGLRKNKAGNIIGTLESLRGKVPDQPLEDLVPDWLRAPDAFEAALQEELAIYREIADRCQRLSGRREEVKVERLLRVLRSRKLVLGFDAHPITLAFLARALRERTDASVIVATGSNQRERREVEAAFRLGAAHGPTIGLCSDTMSEGFNLQGASTVVLLDMPTTIRQAEQRIGRVDRMDSPHREVTIYWPSDGDAYALRSDERFQERHELVAQLLGSNVAQPGQPGPRRVLRAEEIARELADQAGDWEGFEDAFAPVRALVEGETALVAPKVYDAMRTSKVRVTAAVSTVRADRPWAFFAVRGSSGSQSSAGAPRWVFVDAEHAPVVSLATVAGHLRSRLDEATEDAPYDLTAQAWLERLLRRVDEAEEDLLPLRKARALRQMRHVLSVWLESRKIDKEHRELLRRLQRLTGQQAGPRPDLKSVAECWLQAIRPLWYEAIRHGPHRKPVVLKDLTRRLTKDPLSPAALTVAFAGLRPAQPLAERVVAAIVGVPREG